MTIAFNMKSTGEWANAQSFATTSGFSDLYKIKVWSK